MKVGQRARVRKDLEAGKRYGNGNIHLLGDMAKELGKEGVIEKVSSQGNYLIFGWYWAPEMLEPIFSIGDRVTHAEYGDGTIELTGISNAKVRFKECVTCCSESELKPIERSKVMFASELMELARKNPKEYEGKKYNVITGIIRDCAGNMLDKIVIHDGVAMNIDHTHVAYICSYTTLEPLPQPVSFMEAANSGKRIKPDNSSQNYESLDFWLSAMGDSSCISIWANKRNYLNGGWLIEP